LIVIAGLVVVNMSKEKKVAVISASSHKLSKVENVQECDPSGLRINSREAS
jgi:hypothetical protein